MGGPRLQTTLKRREIARANKRSRKRRAGWDEFFGAHLRAVTERLNRSIGRFEIRRAAIRRRQLQAIHDAEQNGQSFRLGTSGRKPQLWEVEGDDA